MGNGKFGQFVGKIWKLTNNEKNDVFFAFEKGLFMRGCL
jgi:hypothetical protein